VDGSRSYNEDEISMTQRRVTATNQLSTVTTALQLGKKTGILTVERGEGDTLEEGTITFVHGQVVQASLGLYAARDAATKLFAWQACRFSFVPYSPENSSLPTPLLPQPQADTRSVTENKHEPFYENQQTNLAAQDEIDRRPSLAVYQESMDDVLHILDRQGFSRVHRRLFLLIDGRRSIRELAALIRRTPDETSLLLTDLWQAGLIRL